MTSGSNILGADQMRQVGGIWGEIDQMTDIAEAEVAMATLRAERDDQRVAMEGNLNGRGSYVETTSGGVAAKIPSAAFEVQADATPTTSMDITTQSPALYRLQWGPNKRALAPSRPPRSPALISICPPPTGSPPSAPSPR